MIPIMLAVLLMVSPIYSSVESGRVQHAAPVRHIMGPSAPLASQSGVASWYGPGTGVASQWCTWTLRTQSGCGWARITSLDTGIVVVAPVIDWCQCYRGTPQERILDLQLGVVAALGLDPSRGLFQVSVEWLSAPVFIPDTSMSP